ncbi:leucine-rich repeat and immunoglobulin-like domain-containing nogo receptor-interacting protein 3 [Ctenocephalides felis]|uniref:leucine-rich repeat and immunoglobulin-like domain-containing nogo receptor-interacting protein 3 n=1 Tax=Ctenocephalides felis TaxID=7515 RepID=UPI000E6E4510|nr:leucine-rich repeat and immunoglobulin-like domain-containing nogo receptor-interacting protein 3 [Ctenocephalides felis]
MGVVTSHYSPMWVLLLLLVGPLMSSWNSAVAAMCPARCRCDDSLLRASCADAALEVVPIQLNPDVRDIDLARNKITNVHFMFTFYARLETLDISHNSISVLGSKNFEAQTLLLTLNLSYNAIEHLAKDVFRGLTSLRRLDLSENRLKSAHAAAFHDLRSLRELNLADNHLAKFEAESFIALVNLQELILDNNQFLDMPTSNLKHTLSLEKLSVSGNLLETIPKSAFNQCRNLRHLSLEDNVISNLDESAFEGLVALRDLNIANNNLTAVPTVQLSGLVNLTRLTLSGNHIAVLPAVAFQSLFQLRDLRVSQMEALHRIDSRAFVDNVRLEEVWLDDNPALDTLPSRMFHGNSHLKLVSVRNCGLKTIEASHFPIDKLQRLQIAGNPLLCNCSLLWLWQLSQPGSHELQIESSAINASSSSRHQSDTSSTTLTLDASRALCSGPERLQGRALAAVPEYEIRCSAGPLAVAAIVLTIAAALAVIGSVLYYLGCTTDRCRRCCGVRGEKRHGPPQHAPPPPPPMTDKFERYHHSGTTPEYHTIGGPWEPLKSTQTMTRPPDDPSLACYRQLVTHNGNGYKPPLPVRPHVVYV